MKKQLLAGRMSLQKYVRLIVILKTVAYFFVGKSGNDRYKKVRI